MRDKSSGQRTPRSVSARITPIVMKLLSETIAVGAGVSPRLESVEVAVLVTVGQLVTCTLAAFAFARLNFPGRDTLFFIRIAGLLFPALVTIVPIHLGFGKVGLLNRPIGLALMYLTSSFGVFLVRQFMRSQPKALEEAALMDGAGYLKIFFRISLPQLRPALASLGIITFTQTWNYYF